MISNSKSMSRYSAFRILLTLIAINLTCAEQEFCDTLIENGYQIYSYGQWTVDHLTRYLIIGHNYWLIDKSSQIEGWGWDLIITKSWRQSNWFGNEYKTGFSIWSNKSQDIITGLIKCPNTSQISIEWGYFDTEEEKGLKVANTSIGIPSTDMFVDFQTDSMFVSLDKSIDTNHSVSLIGIKSKENSTTVLKMNKYQFEKNTTGQLSLTQETEITDDLISRKYKLITIFEEPDKNGRLRIYFIYRKDNRLEYCDVPKNMSKDKCTENDLKILVDCSPNYTFVILIVLIIATIMISIGVYFLHFHRKNYSRIEMKQTITTTDTDSPPKSGSQMSNKSVMSEGKPNIIKITQFKMDGSTNGEPSNVKLNQKDLSKPSTTMRTVDSGKSPPIVKLAKPKSRVK